MPPPPLPSSQQKPKYMVSHQGDALGPFETEFIEAMVMAQVYPASVLVQKHGTSDWVPFNSLGGGIAANSTVQRPNTQISDPPTPFGTPKGKPKKTKPDTVVAQIVGVFAVLVVIWIIATVTSSKKAPKSRFSSTPSPVSSSDTYSRSVLTPTSSSRPSSTYSSSSASTPPAGAMVYRDTSGRTYRVSNSDYHRLLVLQSALSLKKTNVNFVSSDN